MSSRNLSSSNLKFTVLTLSMSLRYFGNELYNRGPIKYSYCIFLKGLCLVSVCWILNNALCSMSWVFSGIYFVPHCAINIWHYVLCYIPHTHTHIYIYICSFLDFLHLEIKLNIISFNHKLVRYPRLERDWSSGDHVPIPGWVTPQIFIHTVTVVLGSPPSSKHHWHLLLGWFTPSVLPLY